MDALAFWASQSAAQTKSIYVEKNVAQSIKYTIGILQKNVSILKKRGCSQTVLVEGWGPQRLFHFQWHYDFITITILTYQYIPSSFKARPCPFILILSWFYPDIILILSRFYPDFILILSRFYPDFLKTHFIQILSRFYPNFWKYLDKIRIKSG